jgi:hypothetical protein
MERLSTYPTVQNLGASSYLFFLYCQFLFELFYSSIKKIGTVI